MYGITKADDVAELKDTPAVQLRNEAFQDMLKAAQKFVVLDDRRVLLSRTQNDALQKLEGDKKILVDQLKAKKKEQDTSNGLASGLNQQLGNAQGEVNNLRFEVERLKKEIVDLLDKRKLELDDAEHKGYDLCFEQNMAEIRFVRSGLFQAGYDRVLDTALVPLVVILGSLSPSLQT